MASKGKLCHAFPSLLRIMINITACNRLAKRESETKFLFQSVFEKSTF